MAGKTYAEMLWHALAADRWSGGTRRGDAVISAMLAAATAPRRVTKPARPGRVLAKSVSPVPVLLPVPASALKPAPKPARKASRKPAAPPQALTLEQARAAIDAAVLAGRISGTDAMALLGQISPAAR